MKKRGLFLVLLLIIMLLYSVSSYATTPLPCTCSISRQTSAGVTDTGITGAKTTEGANTVCKVSCFDASGKIKDACNILGIYTITLTCDAGSYDCDDEVDDLPTCGGLIPQKTLTNFYYDLTVGCSDKDICFNGFDDDCNGADANTIVQGLPNSCICNTGNLGVTTSDGEKICVFDKITNSFRWVDSQTDIFRIYSLNDTDNKEFNIISDSEKWYVCDATQLNLGVTYTNSQVCRYSNGWYCPANSSLACPGVIPTCSVTGLTSLLSTIVPKIAKDRTFPALGFSSSPTADTDTDGCSDWAEFVYGTNPNDGGDSPCSDVADTRSASPAGSSVFIDAIGCLNNNIKNCLGNPSEDNIETTSSSSSPTYQNPYTIQPYTLSDFSSSYICYNDGGKNYIAECCTFGRCINNALVDKTKGRIRAFTDGGVIRTIDNFDIWDANTKTIKNKVYKASFYSGSSNGIYVGVPIEIQNNLNQYQTLEFDIVANDLRNLKIGFKDITAYVSNNLDLSTHLTFNTTYRWHHVSIPLNTFGSLSNVKSLVIQPIPSTLDGQEVAIDNVYLTIVGEETYYCSGYFGEWLSDLDPDGAVSNAPYQWACNAAPGFGWTGNKCCGDDLGESFNDIYGGCFKGYPVMNDTTAKSAINENSFKDLIWINEFGVSASFYQCKPSGSTDYSQILTIPAVNMCNIKGSYFCDYNNTWNNEEAYTYDGTAIPARKRFSHGVVSTESPDMAINNINSSEGCCPERFCWDGKECVDGRSNSSEVNFIPEDYIYLSNSIDTENVIICSEGAWKMTQSKYSPFHDYKGICWVDSQCFYKDDQGNSKCYNNGTIVNLDMEYTDFYCNNGSWSTRTKLLADTMLGIGENSGGAFSILCDEIKKGVTINNNYKGFGEATELKDYSANLRENTNPNNPTYSMCVLSIDKNKNGMFGDDEDNEIIGIPLKEGWGNYGEFFIDVTDCDNNFEILNNTRNSYRTCPSSNTYNKKIYYNNFTKTIIFSQKQFDAGQSQNIFLRIIGWVKGFLGLKTQINNPTYPAISHLNSSQFKNMLNNHLYYYKNGAKQIFAVKEYKYQQVTEGIKKYRYFIYANYTGFDLELCTKKDGTPPQYLTPRPMRDDGSGSRSSITCNEANTTVIMVLNPSDQYYAENNYWPDLTGRTRAR